MSSSFRFVKALAVGGLFVSGLAACTSAPAPANADPVIMVAGTISPEAILTPLKAQLEYDGWKKVYLFELADLGTADIATSANSLKAKVNSVLTATGATKVDIVSHSQGGIVSRYYMKSLGGSSKVDTFVSLSAPNNGALATNVLSQLLGDASPVTITQMTTGSTFLNNLNSGADVPSPVRAYALYSQNDEIVNPVSTSRHDVGVNVRIQDQCPLLVVGHVGMITNRAVYSGVRSALKNETVKIDCLALNSPL